MSTVLDVNLATRPFRNNTLLWTGYSLAVAGLAAFTWWNAHAYLTASRELQELKASLAGIEGKMADLDRRWDEANKAAGRYDVKRLQARALNANNFIEQRSLSWTRLFNLLENIQPYEVRMTSIRPAVGAFLDPTERREGIPEGTVAVAVEGMAQSYDAFLEFERALLKDSHFAKIEPQKADFIQGGELMFGVKFLYDPEGRRTEAKNLVLPHPLQAAAAAEGEGSAEPSADGEQDTQALAEAGAAAPRKKER